MKRYAVYARFSSELQSSKSTDAQILHCKQYVAERESSIVEIYKDEAISGATAFRDDYQRLLSDISKNKFDVLLATSLDRFSRNQGDIAKLYELAVFHEVELVTCDEGDRIDEMHIAFKGMSNALFLKDLAKKTRRGHILSIKNGKNPGSCPYGFDVSNEMGPDRKPVRGKLIKNEAEIDVIQRIFEEFNEGRSPTKIAKGLNADGIKGPYGNPWFPSTIQGCVKYGTGILNNETYIGRRIWNRRNCKKNPETGKTISRPNPENEWIIRDAPELRIISDNLWLSVKARQEEIKSKASTKCKENTLTGCRRTKYMLSDLMFCSECGGKYVMTAKNRYGCSNRKFHGCTNKRTVRRDVIENKVLSVLWEKLLTPESLNKFIDDYLVHRKQAEKDSNRKQCITEKELKKTKKNIDAVMSAIKAGVVTETTHECLLELEAEKRAQEKALVPKSVIPKLEKNLIDEYRQIIKDLSATLDENSAKYKAMEKLRPLVDKIIIHPTEKGVQAEFYGNLEGLIYICARKPQDFFIPQKQITQCLGSKAQRYLTPPPIQIDIPFWR